MRPFGRVPELPGHSGPPAQGVDEVESPLSRMVTYIS
jgi:hypothetical protein